MFKVCQKGIRTKDKGQSFGAIIFPLFLIFAFSNACAVSCIPRLAPDMCIGLYGCSLFKKISCSKYVRRVLEPRTKDKALR